MTRILIAYYSRTGHTRRVAVAIAKNCGAELEDLTVMRNYKGVFGYWRAAREALSQKPTTIGPTVKDPGEFDLVVVGTPVWAGNMSTPTRAYLTDHGPKIKRLAVFCTEGGSGGEKVLTQMASLCAREPIARLIVTEAEIKSGRADARVREFGECLSSVEAASASSGGGACDAA